MTMDKFLKIAGITLVAWVALGLFVWVFKFLASAVFWVALVAGGIWLVSSVLGKNKRPVDSGADYSKIR